MSLSKDSKQCYKCHQLLECLNIEYNSSRPSIFMWNKYQIYIYEDFKYKSPALIFTPEYQIHRLLIAKNYFLCLDTNGFVHITALDFKKSDQLNFRSIYQPRDEKIKACVNYSSDKTLSLKYDSGTYYLCLNKFRLDFLEVKKVALKCKDCWPLEDNFQDKYFLAHRQIDELCCGLFQKLFNTEKLNVNFHFTAISFDKRTVYGCLFDEMKMVDTIDIVKIYTCPSEISSIEMIGTESTYMIIGLQMGTVIRLTLNELYSCNSTAIEPEVEHLNSALHKLIVIDDTFLYTDGVTMWKADNIFSEDISFTQFFVKKVKDFILLDDQIICTTFSRMIYTFSFKADESYIKPEIKEYSAADEVLANEEYLQKIFVEVEKSNELSYTLTAEGTYISALSMANRQELMHEVISTAVTVYGCFEEVMKENKDTLTLTENISQYVDPSIYLFLVTLNLDYKIPGGISEMVSNIMIVSDANLEVTVTHKNKILKSTSVRASSSKYLIPVDLEYATDIVVILRIIGKIPGTYDKKQLVWLELYRDETELTAEHFIRANFERSLISLKAERDFEKSIICTMNRNKAKFTNILLNPCYTNEMYVRLPQKFDSRNFRKYFKGIKSQFIIQMLGTTGFLTSKEEIEFNIGKEEVSLKLVNDGFSNPRLKIMSGSLTVAASIKKFFSQIVYGENECQPMEEFVNSSFYTFVENFQLDVRTSIVASASKEEFEPLREKFEKEIIGMLPI